jgi:DnaJ domain
MSGEVVSEALSFGPSGASLVALLATLPGLFVFYLRYRLAGRALWPTLSLRKLESIELQRSVVLYRMVSKRVKEGCGEFGDLGDKDSKWWRSGRRSRGGFRQQFREELEDFETYARDLRSTIIRLRGRPLRRYKYWAHIVSAQFALSRTMACYSIVLALTVATLCYFEPILWVRGIDAGFKALILWQAVKVRLLFANLIAVDLVAVAIPVLYLARRASLNQRHLPHIRNLKAFAATDPDQLVHEERGNEERGNEEASEEAREGPLAVTEDTSWFAVLGVLPSATIEEVRQAYKSLIKKSHPDRVHDMSPSLVKLAEFETKKLNSAYATALTSFQGR